MSELKPLDPIVVPIGGVASLQLQLVPPFRNPSDNRPANWSVLNEAGEVVDANSLQISFNSDSQPYQRMRERALLMVTLSTAGSNLDDRFKFFGSGLEYAEDHEDVNDDVTTDLSKDGQTLVFTIQNQGGTQSTVDFGFLVSRKNRQTGELHIFEGPDPRMEIIRI
ncbi:DP-EP family protein [Simiduia sp. 21SJ11W-1]|uniref:DP-EP family protein n=1 Tax=Simiduia sp. 21SJ11W-1 TaxID=2909669 RepID=UPI00209FF45B|nr:DP-EP family protein [Simiduia sp. 21SJ11W-1]UTA47633.1 DP-EP family protein [Simiduia sp. 21SJ11W-1]